MARKRTSASKRLPPMAGRGGQLKKGRRNFAMAKRMMEASDLYSEGLTQHQIAARTGESQATVSRDLRVAYEEMRQATISSMVVWRDRSLDSVKGELVKVERVESEAWAAWERSKKDATSEHQKQLGAGDGKKKGEIVEINRRKEGQVGDPRFLAVLDRCQERRTSLLRFACEVVGVLGPDRTPPGDGGAAPIDAHPGDVLVIRVRRDGTPERRPTA